MCRNPPQALPWIPTNQEIVPAMRKYLDDYADLVRRITSEVNLERATYANVVKPLASFANAHSGFLAVVFNMKYFMPDPETQKLAEEAESLQRQDTTWLDQNLSNLLVAVKANARPPNEETERLLNKWIQGRSSDGPGLSNLDSAAVAARRVRTGRIQELCNQMIRNNRENTGGEWFSTDELIGVPEKFHESSDRTDGKAFYSYNSKYSNIMQYAELSTTRERMHRGFHLAAEANAEPFREIMLLRDLNARDIGALNHAETQLYKRCAVSVVSVQQQLDELVLLLDPYGREAYERVKDTKRHLLQQQSGTKAEKGGKSVDDLLPSEYAYFDRLTSKNEHIDNELISEWFPLKHTFRAMLDLFSDYLQMECIEMDGKDIRTYVWHPDVQIFAVWDARPDHDGAFIGYLFADVLSRPHKHRNAQSGYVKDDRTRVYPANIIMCNFTNLHDDTGYLLTHKNVTTMFHELGHSMHDLLSRTEHATFHGYTGPSELVEGIGEMLEEWCWVPEEISKLSLHYTRTDPVYAESWRQVHPGQDLPPETIPSSLLEPQTKQRGLQRVLSLLRIMIGALFDMKIYSPPSHEAILEMDFAAVYRDIYKRLQHRDIPNPSYQYCQNTIITSVYDAGYYSYIYAEIFAADFFQTHFASNPSSRETWQKFREEVLEPGSSRPGVDIIRTFLGGRDADPKKLLVGVDGTYVRPSLRGTTSMN